MYQFQCNHCFIVSGHISSNPQDAPTCCGGESMTAILIEDPIRKMHSRIDAMADDQLIQIWNALKDYDPVEMYAPGITMDMWAEAIYVEMNNRNLPTK